MGPIGCVEAFVALATRDMNRLVLFYGALLGSPPATDIPGRYAEFWLPNLKLGIFQPSPAHQSEFARFDGGPLSLCLEVQNLEDAIAHLTALGYPPPGAILEASHGREIYGFDPDGNRLIFHEPSAISR